MILDSTLTLEAVLAGAITTSQPEVMVDYIVWTNDGVSTKPAPFRTALNSTTEVTILSAPGTQGHVKEPEKISIYNKDTVSATPIVQTYDGTTRRIIARVTLATLESLHYEKAEGWYVLQANGARKLGAGTSGPTSSTDNAVVRWDGAASSAVQNSGVIIDDSDNVSGVTSIDVDGAGGVSLKSAQLQAFVFQVTNTAGTLQHRISADASLGTLPTWSNKINGASVSLQNTPTGADGSTAFVGGLKISSADATRLYFDTAAQTTADAFCQAVVINNDTGTAYIVSPRFSSIDINGVTRNRLAIRLVNAATGASTNWSTANIGSGTSIVVGVMALLF